MRSPTARRIQPRAMALPSERADNPAVLRSLALLARNQLVTLTLDLSSRGGGLRGNPVIAGDRSRGPAYGPTQPDVQCQGNGTRKHTYCRCCGNGHALHITEKAFLFGAHMHAATHTWCLAARNWS